MPQALPAAVRDAIWNRAQLGHSSSQIAHDLQLCERTVRHLVRQRRRHGPAGLQCRYENCGSHPKPADDPLHQPTLQLRELHPRWGAGRLRLQLAKLAPPRCLPSERTLQRWLRAQGLSPTPAGRPPRTHYQRSQIVHETWQVDAAEQKRLANGQPISWLRVVDECSGAVLATVVSPQGHFNCVPLRVVQQHLRRIFTTWGRPQALRVDNGSPWGSASDLPPDLPLWLFGLGLQVIWNPPRRPQDNGVVERSHGVAKDWAEPGQCSSIRQLQRRLDEEDHLQREEYPSIAGQARLTAYPQLRHSGRAYSRQWERNHWDWQLVATQLSAFLARRRVDCGGNVGLYHHKLYVGTRHKGLEVFVQFDPERAEWVVSDQSGRQLHRTAAEMLDPQRIQQLAVSRIVQKAPQV